MERVIYLCFCTLLLCCVSVCGQRRRVVTPCPNIFKYHTDQYGTHGDLLLYPNGQKTNRIVLQVNFTVPVQLFNNYYGNIFLYNEKQALPNYNRGSPMKYKITFPVQSPLPLCVSIEVNGNVICSGPRDVLLPNTYLSDFSLQHTAFLYYTNNQPQDYGTINQPIDYGPINQPIDYGTNIQPQDYGTNSQPQDYGTNYQLINYPPINQQPVTQRPVYPVYRPPVTQAPVYRPPVTQATVYRPPVTQAPVYRPPVTQAPVYRPPVTEAPVYQPPVYPDDNLNNLWGDNGNSPDYVDPIPIQPVSVRPIKPIFQQPVTQRLPQSESVSTISTCGHPAPLQLIIQGKNYEKGALPWLVAIYKRTGGNLEFKCGGTLVSDRHVITAAHCMQLRTQIYNYADLTVRVGVYDLDEWTDADVVQVTLKSAIIHERYNSSTLENDIMILLLEKRVTYTNFIRPACLWSGPIGLDIIAGNSGIVAGWGQQSGDGDLPNLPQMATLPIVTNKQCREQSPQLHTLTYDTTLCAGDLLGTGPCKGDSGGGLYINDRGTWRLRGIISKALRQDDGSCNLNEFVVFTDTAQYLPWIRQVMNR